jgi:hypothetical protein
MNRDTKREPDWEDIDRLIAEPFDLEDVGNRYGVSRWREEMEKVGVAGDEEENRCSSEEVFNAAVAFFRADIEENILIYRAKLIRNERIRKLMDLRDAIAESGGVFVEDENGGRVIPGGPAAIRETRSSKIRKLKQVVSAAEAMANSGVRGEADLPSWPAGLGDGFDVFVKDLADYLEENQGEGIEMVHRVCQDVTFAGEMCDDVVTPRCIRFLAEIVMNVKTVTPLRRKQHTAISLGNR